MSRTAVRLLVACGLLAIAPPSSAAGVLQMGAGHARAGGCAAGGAPLGRSPLVLEAGGVILRGGSILEEGLRNLRTEASIVAKGVSAGAKSALDMSKYPKLFAAGGLCASLTHYITVPIDVVKTRQQVNPGEFTSLAAGIKSIFKAEGLKGIMRGAMPTTCGFLLQGSLKYGFYEFFKDNLAIHAQKSEGKDKKKQAPSGKLPIPQMILSGAAAEVLGTTALLPFESTRIRMVADPGFGTGMVQVMSRLVRKQGIKGLYGGLVPIMCKQIPFTIAQFLIFEFAATAAYSALSAQGLDTQKLGTGITLGSGIIAGTTASLISQPGDTVLSVMSKAPGLSIGKAVKQLGPLGLFRGGSARMVHVSSYVVAQFLIYDSIKRLCGIPVAGQQAAAKPQPAKKR